MKQIKLMNVKRTRGRSSRPSQESSHRCRICGRPLTDAISIERGVGGECWDRYLAQRDKVNLFDKVKE